MSKKELLDDFLRNKLGELPTNSAGKFDTVEKRLVAKKQQGILVLLLIPFLLSGLYWLGSFTEKDVYMPLEQHFAKPVVSPSAPNSAPVNNVEVKSLESALESTDQNSISSFGQKPKENPQSRKQAIAAVTSTKSPKTEPVIIAELIPEPDYLASEKKTEARIHGEADAQLIVENSAAEFKAEENSTSQNDIVAMTSAEVQHSTALQVLPEDVRETSNWSVTLNFYPNYTFREFQVKPAYQAKVNSRYEEIINDSEKGGFAFNTGVDVRYHFGNNVFMGSGLSFIQTKISGRYNFEIYSSQIADKNGNLVQDEVFAKPIQIDQGIVQTYQFLQVPVHVSYQPWVNKRLRLIVEGGVSYIRFLRADGKTIDYTSLGVRELNTMPFNKNMTSFDFKVGASFYPTPKVAFGLEPTLMYFSNSIYAENCPVDVVPWSVGVNFNVRVRLY